MSAKRQVCHCGRRLTKRHAIQVLIEHAARDVAGVGCGVRQEWSRDKHDHVVFVIRFIWTDAWHFPCDDNSLRNMGLMP